MILTDVNTLLDLSVAVINFNGATSLIPALKSVYALEGVRLATVMVVDNASTDDSVAVVKQHFPEVQVCCLPENRGPNPARNTGLRRAATDLVLIMDNDIVLAADYIMRLAEVFRKRPATGAASGQIRIHDEPGTVQYNGIDIHYAGEIAARPLEARDTVRVSCVSAGAALFNRSHTLGAGGFDEDFFIGWEDGDLTFRLSLAGYPCYMVSGAVAYHMRRQRGMKWVRYQTRNRWWFMMKNYDLRTFLLALPAIVFFQFCAGLFLLLKGQGRAFLQGTVEAWADLPAIWRKRRTVQRLKKVPDTALLRGDRFDLPGGLSSSQAGRVINAVLNKLFFGYWLCIRLLLRRRPRETCGKLAALSRSRRDKPI